MTKNTLRTLFVGAALLCLPTMFAQDAVKPDSGKPTITPIDGGFFVEWSSPKEISAIQLGKGLHGKLEVMFDIPSVDFIKNVIDNKPAAPEPFKPEMVAALSEYWMVRGKPEKAIAHYEEALKQGNLTEDQAMHFQNNLAMLHSQAGDHEKALGIVDKALETKKDNVVLLDTKGLIYLNSGRPMEAIPPLQDAVDLSCQLPIYMMHLAQAYNQTGRASDARRFFEPVRAQLVAAAPKMTKENKKMFDDLQRALPGGEQ
jgi:predicted Zn-dependent protease